MVERKEEKKNCVCFYYVSKNISRAIIFQSPHFAFSFRNCSCSFHRNKLSLAQRLEIMYFVRIENCVTIAIVSITKIYTQTHKHERERERERDLRHYILSVAYTHRYTNIRLFWKWAKCVGTRFGKINTYLSLILLSSLKMATSCENEHK